MIAYLHFNKEHIKNSKCPPWLLKVYDGTFDPKYYYIHKCESTAPSYTICNIAGITVDNKVSWASVIAYDNVEVYIVPVFGSSYEQMAVIKPLGREGRETDRVKFILD